MTNIEKWPEAFENGIPKVGGKWHTPYQREIVVGPTVGANVYERGSEIAFHYLWRFVGAEAKDSLGFVTFLGFSDSATLVIKGAAAPQKPSRVEAGQAWQQPGGKTYDVAGPWSAGSSDVLLVARDATGSLGCWNADRILRDWIFISAPAPIVAPPPSLKAAVQQEGLSIPPQVGTRHEVFEKMARDAEAGGFHASAKDYRGAGMRKIVAADLAYDEEANAIRENRVIKKIALKEMGRGDRACFKARNLREFEAIKSAEHGLWMWWKS